MSIFKKLCSDPEKEAWKTRCDHNALISIFGRKMLWAYFFQNFFHHLGIFLCKSNIYFPCLRKKCRKNAENMFAKNVTLNAAKRVIIRITSWHWNTNILTATYIKMPKNATAYISVNVEKNISFGRVCIPIRKNVQNRSRKKIDCLQHRRMNYIPWRISCWN